MPSYVIHEMKKKNILYLIITSWMEKIKEREKCGPKIIIAIIHDAAVVVVD